MTKNLYKVKSSESYKGHFVFAHGYDEAARKVLNFLIEEEEEKQKNRPLLDKDGSLNSMSLYDESDFKPKEFKITEIEMIADFIIS